MRQSRPNEGPRQPPRWTRLLGDDALDEEAGGSGWRIWKDPATPSETRWLGDREKALAGAAGTVVVALAAAMLLWQATGAALGTVVSQKPERAAAAPAAVTPATRGVAASTSPSPVPTATRGVVTITIVPTAEGPPAATAAPTTAATTPPTMAPTAAATRAAAVPTTAPVTSPATTAGAVHTVEKGDTLFSIARRNGTTVGALVAANGLASPDAVLSVGRRLVIP